MDIKNKMNTVELIQTYINHQHLYEKYSERLTGLLKTLLYNAGIQYQQITYRAKNPQQLKNKINRKQKEGKIYQNLNDITDLAGVRIIVYFKDDIPKVLQLLKKNFKIHKKHSVCLNQEILKKPREFKYKSEHRIIALKNNKGQLWAEYEKLRDLKCEVQIRTVLEHAWAEIEHGIGYKPKNKKQTQKEVKLTRMFAQNSALLEVADENFIKIKQYFEGFQNQRLFS